MRCPASPDSSSADPCAAFAQLSRAFLALRSEAFPTETARLVALRGLLGDLIGAVHRLEADDPIYGIDEDLEERLGWTGTTDARWRADWGAVFPSLGFYPTFANPSVDVADPKHVLGDAIDDLADISGELEEGLVMWDHDLREPAAGHWRAGFDIHWGQHAIGLLTCVHGTLRAADG